MPTTQHTYTVYAYAYAPRRGELVETVHTVTAPTSLAALAKVAGPQRRYANLTRRRQNAPDEAMRDNCHAQLNGAGTIGWAVERAGVDEAAVRPTPTHTHQIGVG
jgi:hypothetical protein